MLNFKLVQILMGKHQVIDLAAQWPINSNGTKLAVGAPLNDGNGSSSGHARIFEYSGGSGLNWGSDIDGEASGDRFGHSIAIDSDGDRVAISAYANDGNGSNSGHVRVLSIREAPRLN